MRKKLSKHGNSYALVIERPILELLRIDPETTELEVSTDGQELRVRPAGADRRSIVQAALERTDEKYADALKRLAE